MHSVKRVLRDTVLVVLGNAILAFGVAVFAVPSSLIVGGATGLSLIIGHFIPVNYASIVLVLIWLCWFLDSLLWVRNLQLGQS